MPLGCIGMHLCCQGRSLGGIEVAQERGLPLGCKGMRCCSQG